jgi:hypothetical protein
MPTAKIVKPTTKNSSPMRTGHARDNKPAVDYAAPHTMSGSKEIDLGVCYATDPNTMPADESTPGGMPARRVSIGNMTRGPKEDGIKIRGTGAATKGVMARGPMA